MATTPEGEKHLRHCADRARDELKSGETNSALASVISDFSKDDLTSGLDPMLVMMIVGEAVGKGPEALDKAIMGFNV